MASQRELDLLLSRGAGMLLEKLPPLRRGRPDTMSWLTFFSGAIGKCPGIPVFC